jgi:pilus assembly protein CpaF
MTASSFSDPPAASAAQKVLRAIQEIPSMKHLPVLDRQNREHDVALESCIKKMTNGLDESLVVRIRSELFGYGLLETLAENEAVSEILLLGPDTVWVEVNGRLQAHCDRFLDKLTYRNFVARISRDAKTNTDDNRPFGSGRWRGFRVHVVSEPIVQGLPHVSLRRIRASPWTLEQLQEAEWTDAAGIAALRRLVEHRKNVLVVGATGSGKTSALAACVREVRENERVVILEDTDELPTPNQVSAKLLTKISRSPDDLEFDLAELLKQSLRMRPERIVMGEVRGKEAKDLLMAFATGHTGCWGTLHAASPREALLRLEMLVQMGAPQWTATTVRSLIHASIDSIVVVSKEQNGKRRLDSIHQVASLEDIGFCFSAVYQRR